MKKYNLLILQLVLLILASSCKSDTSFDQLVSERRSVRNFDPSKIISEDQVRTLLATTQEAPSWANVQSTRYHVVMSAEKRKALEPIMGRNARNIEHVPVVIVTTFRQGESGFFDGQPSNELGDSWGAFDNGLSNAFLILKAKNMGFDTLIMGLRDATALHELLDIPDYETITSVVALGVGKVKPDRPNRKELNEIVKFY